MSYLLQRLDSADTRTFSAAKWLLSALSAGVTIAFVIMLEAM